MQRNSKMSITLNLALLLVTAMGCLLVGEMGVRLFSPQDLETHPRGLYKSDAKLGWSLTPKFSGIDLNPEYEVRVEINTIGLREREIEPKLPAEQRILILGDSFTFGIGVEAEESYPRRVEAELRTMGRQNVRVINAGVPGYGTLKELTLFERIVDEIHPDAVAIGFFLGNDLFDNLGLNDAEVVNGYMMSKVLGSRAQLTQALGIPVEVKLWLRTRLHLYSLLMKGWSTLLAKRGLTNNEEGLEIYREKVTDRVREAVGVTREVLARFADACRTRKIPLGLVILPHGWLAAHLDGTAGHSLARPAEFIREIATLERIPFLDLSEDFGGLGSAKLYFPVDGHWNARGHYLAGQAIAHSLRNGRLKSLLVEMSD